MESKVLLQQGEHVGQVIEVEFTRERLLLKMQIEFAHGITLPFEFKVDPKEGGKFLRDIYHGQLKDTSQLLNRQAWFFVELVTVKTGRSRFGLNTITKTTGTYHEQTPVAATRG
jgi:hypothetical protein